MPLISYKLFLEMASRGRGAIQGDLSKFPLNYEDDDLKFLNQFDMKYYAQASEQRFDMLHDALKKLHDKRLDIIKNGDEKKGIPKDFDKEIKNFLLTGESKNLSQEDQRKIRNYRKLPITPATMRGMRDKFDDNVAEIAKEDAFEIVKQKTENLKALELDPPAAKFLLKGSKITAIPYLNRLYHRLERTRGEAHIGIDDNGVLSDSEHSVGSLGKYGYDLSHPRTEHDPESDSKKHYTRGMSWVGSDVWDRSIKEYIKHSSHGHFGVHPRVLSSGFSDDVEIKWLPMDGKNGRPKIEDPTYDWMLEDEIDRQTLAMKELLDGSRPKKVEIKTGSLDDRVPIAHGKKQRKERFDKALTNDQKKEVKKIATEIVNNKVRSGEVSAPSVPGVDSKERKFEITSGKTAFGGLISPFVYLPHEYIDEKWIPLLNPSTYLKKVKDEAKNTQYKLDDTNRMGSHFGDTTDSKNVGISPNKNVPSKNYLDPNDPANDIVVKKFEKEIIPDGEIRKEFEQGVRNCLTGNCGGANRGVKDAILRNPSTFEGLVNDVIIAAYNQLGEHSQVWSDPKTFAIGVVTNYLQGAVHDMATRRLRGIHVHGFNSHDPSQKGYTPDDKRRRGGRKHSNHREAMNKAQKEYASAMAAVARTDGLKGLEKYIAAGDGAYADFFDAVKEELIGRGITQTKADLLVKNWINQATPLPTVATIVNGMNPVTGKPISGDSGDSSPTISPPAPLPISKPTATSVRNPLLGRVKKIIGDSPTVDNPQIDWKILSGLTFFERVEILKRIRRS